MALTPLEIRKKSFRKAFSGYAPKDVRAFLAIVANEFEELKKERAALAEKVDELAAKLAAYEKTENLLKETLLTAQQVANELKTNAQRKKEVIIQQIEQEAERLRNDLKELHSRRNMIIDEIRGIANTYLAIVERFEKENRERTPTKDSGKHPGDQK